MGAAPMEYEGMKKKFALRQKTQLNKRKLQKPQVATVSSVAYFGKRKMRN